MSKYLGMLKYELKNILKDKMSMFMLFYPILMVVIAGILIPLSLQSAPQQETIATYTAILIVFSTLGSIMGGMLLGFSILDNKDEKTFNSIAVTPLSIKGYIIFKSVFCTTISFIGSLILFYGIKLLAFDNYITMSPSANVVQIFDLINNYQLIAFCLASSFLTPVIGLVLGALAKNKVEGLVYMKTGGIVVILPVLVMLPTFNGGLQYLLGIFPNFWCVKALFNGIASQTDAVNLPFYIYLIIGAVYSLLLCILSYHLFKKKIQLES